MTRTPPRMIATPTGGAPSVDGMLTGWHGPAASHLAMLDALAGRELVARSYVHLLLP